MSQTNTTDRLLDEAQRLVQLGGFNGFSYADISKAIGITKPSIHYYFPTKQDLALELLRRYRRQLQNGFEWLNSSTQDPKARLTLYIQFFAGLVKDGRLCLCAALAADAGSLSAQIQLELQGALEDKKTWLAQNLTILKISEPNRQAALFVATVEGAMLLARAYNDLSTYNTICQDLLERF